MNVVCIGSGNVATHLVGALHAAGMRIVQVWSRTAGNAEKLAGVSGAQVVTGLSEITVDADLYIISVKDDAIPSVCASLPVVKGTVVHTSGATSLDVLSSFDKPGVLYPLQTFSKSRNLDFQNVPLCLEAGNEEVMQHLKEVASGLGCPAYEIDSAQRRILHLSAAFACNFVNHLYALGDLILSGNGLDFALLRPLIAETAGKIQEHRPAEVQTGPAVRDDQVTMAAHLALLAQQPELARIYEILSESIKKTKE